MKNINEQIKELFEKKKEFAKNINIQTETKVKALNGAPDLHSYNNFGEKTNIINQKQEKINSLFKTLNKEQKMELNELFDIFINYNSEADWL